MPLPSVDKACVLQSITYGFSCFDFIIDFAPLIFTMYIKCKVRGLNYPPCNVLKLCMEHKQYRVSSGYSSCFNQYNTLSIPIAKKRFYTSNIFEKKSGHHRFRSALIWAEAGMAALFLLRDQSLGPSEMTTEMTSEVLS